MAISWVEPLQAPQNVVGTASAGGAVPIDTYYVVVLAKNYDHYSTESTSTPALASPISEEVTVEITSGNQTLDVSWDAVTGAGYYQVYITTKAPGESKRWVNCRYYEGTNGNFASTTNNSISISSETWRKGYDIQDFSLVMHDQTGFANVVDGNVTAEGLGYLQISGACGSLDILDLTDVLDSAGVNYFYDGDKFVVHGGLYVASGATGSLTIQGNATSGASKIIMFMESSLWSDEEDFAINFTKCKIYSDAAGAYFGGWGAFTKNTTLTQCFISMSGKDQSTAGITNDLPYYSPNGITDGGGNVIGPVNFNLNASTKDFVFNDIIFQGDYGYWLAKSITINRGILFNNTSLTYGRTTNTMLFSECRMNTITCLDYGAVLQDIQFLNCDFTTLSSGAVTSNLRPIVSWTVATANKQLKIYNTLRISVVDTSNNPVVATIVVNDINGTNLFNEATDSNGVFDNNILATLVSKNNDVGIGTGYDYTSFVDYSPLTLTLSKSGYITQTHKITMDEKKDLVFTMERQVPVYIGKGKAFVNTSPADGQNNILA